MAIKSINIHVMHHKNIHVDILISIAVILPPLAKINKHIIDICRQFVCPKLGLRVSHGRQASTSMEENVLFLEEIALVQLQLG